MPWRMLDVVRLPQADYLLKFVATPRSRAQVEYFRQYFLDNGVPSARLHVVDDVRDQEEIGDEADEAVPPARKIIESGR